MNSLNSLLTQSLQHSQFAAASLDLLLKSLVILALAGGVCLAWRHGAASARHLVWLLAVAGLLGLPALSKILPAWSKPLWTVGTQASSRNMITLTLELAPNNQVATPPRETTASSSVATPGQNPALAASVPPLAAHFGAGWIILALGLWLAGAIILLLSIARGSRRLRLLRRAAEPPANADWLPLLGRLCGEMGVGRRVTLLQSGDKLMPVTWGWWRPVIVLPAEADEWSPERLRVVLMHELAHVRRGDCLTQLIARLACAVYWFNPLVWVAARRMCVERERACDDLVLDSGCKASLYAGHLVEIARTFRRVPPAAAIAMARPSHLEGRIAAIVDATRSRRAPRALLVCLCGAGALALVATVAAQKPAENPPAAASAAKPWFDARLRAFFAAKEAQARILALTTNLPVASEVWPYFQAGVKGDWQTTTNLWTAMRARAHQYEGTRADATLDVVWSPILETELAWEQFANWGEKYVLAYGNDIINSIPPGAIYFGGTDPGRGVITAMSAFHAEGKPFYTITQNALADGTYLAYLRTMYGPAIYMPTGDDSRNSFNEYEKDARQRFAGNKLKPGEDVRVEDTKDHTSISVKGGKSPASAGTGPGEPKLVVGGPVAVMSINALIAKTIFDRNPDREFYVEESLPLDWMYPHLSPNGLIMKVNRQPLPELSDEVVQRDGAYWSSYLQPILGDWLKSDTSPAEVAAFAEKVYLQHDLGGFTGDPKYLADTWAQKAFSKLRSSIAGVYAWRATNAKTPVEKQRMNAAADFAFRQAYALCPSSPEALFRYSTLLISLNRGDDARVLAETSLKLDPQNAQVRDLLAQLKNPRSEK